MKVLRSRQNINKPFVPCTMTRRLTALTLAAAAVLSADAFVPSPSASAGRAAFATPSTTSLEARADGLGEDTSALMGNVGKAIATAALALAVFNPSPAFADGQTEKFKLPPIDKNDKMRCQFNDSKMGQANAQRDKLYDLRQCKLSGQDASGFDLSGVIMTDTDASKVKFVESQFSKGYLHDSNFEGADFTNGVIDRASFKGSSLKGAIFGNAVLTGTSFEGSDVENADFTDAYIGSFDQKQLCRNPTLKGENPTTGADTKFSAGCSGP